MNKGFTLIELLFVIVILTILAAITYPNYRDYMTRARRSDGQTALFDLAIRFERYYAEHGTYQTATIATGNSTDLLSRSISPDGFYTLSVTNATDSAYTIQATPQNTQANNDTVCQSFTLNSVGSQGITKGPAGDPIGQAAHCWKGYI